MPADTNQYGDIFGGWLLGQMDIAGGIFAAGIAKGRTATVAVDAMTFRKPVFVGDVMCIYTDLIRIGNTSVTVHVEAWVIRRNQTRWTVSDSRVRSTLVGIKPSVRQGTMLGGNVGLVSSQEYRWGLPLSSVALLLCRCRGDDRQHGSSWEREGFKKTLPWCHGVYEQPVS
jgi:acyl-CoA hydrolase